MRNISALLFIISLSACQTSVSNIKANKTDASLSGKKEETAEEYRVLGYEEQQQGNYYKALSYYTKAIVLGLENEIIFNDLGVVYELMGMPGKAEENYLKALEWNRGYLPPYGNLAYFYKAQNNKEKAIEYFRKRFEQAGPGDPWAEKARQELIELDSAYHEKTLQFEAQKLNREMIEEARGDLTSRMTLANTHYQKSQEWLKRKKHPEALRELEEALRITPRNPKILASLSEIHYSLGEQNAWEKRFRDAIEEFNAALRYAPDNKKAFEARQKVVLEIARGNIKEISERALNSLNAEDTSNARGEIEQVLKELRNDPNLIAKETRRIHQDWASSRTDELNASQESSPAEHYQKGLEEFQSGNYQKALVQFDLALQENPRDPEIPQARKQALIEWMKQSIQQRSERAVDLLEGGNVQGAQKEIQDILDGLYQSKDAAPEQTIAYETRLQKGREEFNYRIDRSLEHYHKGLAFFEETNFEDAIIEFNRALEYTPENSKIIEMRDKALLELAKQNIQAYSDQAIKMLDSGDAKSAKDEVQKMLTTIPNESF